jgi:hypothetical protein
MERGGNMQIKNSLKIVLDGKVIKDEKIRTCDHRWGDGRDEYTKTITLQEDVWEGTSWRLEFCDMCKAFVLFVDEKEYWTFPTGRKSLKCEKG